MEKIDFVITWVDGSDEKWIAKKREYERRQAETEQAGDVRYREWGLLPYLFRGIERYAPWVNHVFLVTDGQIPKWLNTDHPKVSVVYHDRFIRIHGKDHEFAEIQFHNMALMNSHYSVKDCKKNLRKWLKPSYGRNLFRTLFLLPFQRLQGIYNPHGRPVSSLGKGTGPYWMQRADADFVRARTFRHIYIVMNSF